MSARDNVSDVQNPKEENVMFCRSCGTENDESAKFCRGCGLPIVPVEETENPKPVEDDAAPSQAGPTPQGQPYQGGQGPVNGQPYGQPGPQAAYAAHGQMVKQPTSGSAVVSLIFGILSVVCCSGVIFGIGFGITAICVGASDRKKNGSNGVATAGLILGIIGLSLAVIFLIWFFASGAFFAMMDAIRTGRLSDFLRDFGDYGSYSYYGF